MIETGVWLELAKILGPVIAPFVALAGAIWLYYAKQKADRVDARRKERLDLFTELLAYNNELYSTILKGPTSSKEALEFLRGGQFHNRLRLLANDPIYYRAVNLHSLMVSATHEAYDSREGGPQIANRPPVSDDTLAELGLEQLHLVEAMRLDLGTEAPVKTRRIHLTWMKVRGRFSRSGP